MNRDLYACHDVNPQGMFRVTEERAKELNPQGYGIFWTVNDFGGKPRQKHNLCHINAWYVDIDNKHLDKSSQLALIEASPVVPNLIIETKNGFHLYWNSRLCSENNYKNVLSRIRIFFGGDPNAQDLTRVLRVPGFFHMKDPNDPYLVQVVWTLPGTYFEKLMLWNFPAPEDDEPNTSPTPRAYVRLDQYGKDFWAKVYAFDSEEALRRLSGSRFVNGEIFTFRPVGGGKLNICVNGRSTSSFIDSSKRIGSLDHGGPSYWQWLKWYGHDHKTIYQISKDYFPEVMK